MTSTKSKPSTGSDTDTKKNRWFRIGAAHPELPEFEQLLDLYWGGPERHITGLTLRIIAVNAVALVLLMIGTLYLGQYQKNLIEAKLETFNAEVELISAALSEGAIEEYKKPATLPFEESETLLRLAPEQGRQMVRRLSQTMQERILLFDKNGKLVADSEKLTGPGGIVHISPLDPPDDTLYTIQILKSMTRFILAFLPERRALPPYPKITSESADAYPDADDAIRGKISFSAWHNKDGGIFLSAAAPLNRDSDVVGAVLLTREAHDIEAGVGKVWMNIICAFFMTLFVTILLSIYLSGAIARPLRKLAAAAEGVRKGKLNYNDIPDLSNRHDEIGELSIALRQMTLALWERMDTIERFAADVAHELKNPLTSLRSAVETALIVKEDNDRKKLMDIIKHDVDRLDRLISDISHASRLDAELSREALEKIDLRSALQSLIDAYKDPLERGKSKGDSLAKSGHAEIRLNFESAEKITIWGLDGRLQQVFQNLLSNALSFSPENGVVSIRVMPRHKRVKIIVEDQGPGIPENKLETIFERFYTQRPDHEGYGRHSGLGLSICRQIVTALGGEIYAENAIGANGKTTGARFTVVLNMI